MSKGLPTVSKYMTSQPHTSESNTTLKEAINLMAKQNIRHLPVTKQGDLTGIVSEHDLKLASGLQGVDPNVTTIGDIYHTHVFTVNPDAPLDEVVAEMAQRRIGSAIVLQNHHIVGILTSVDVCEALKDILEVRFHTH